ncbi:hypothetical protein Sipo8835_14590 [Streptomyces ipomoeae]|jgi:hypothetical protein|uniref:Uncharacterized protein n=2 Tax=Streptomyces ipomoeae TaxID=103232 RepID=L1L8I6_9ACTN|nr:hypothetical protein [Streptomyces ipomoeae]EKX69326.1 hypothetical protein STRIP9103_06550 [Streptomyces ipomoeae 91-03]MDX2699081.1 hypothetical protein [Streptomyces ipomoeae]MDX2826581.1 hypothetical protein [Streptomyces ipomoeae]MDX2844254.1 hypothetical protein [Streptomyces ipomoeae]MDX2879257.1 hypothetical protein [Streptomyces ipomoeae]
MAVDPSDPDTFATDDAVALDDVEAPEADAAEQHTNVTPDRDDSLTDADPNTANEADLAEQARVVSLDEDDYR